MLTRGRWQQALRDDRGQDLIEYAILGVFIAILCVLVFPSIHAKMSAAFSSWGGQVNSIWIPCNPGQTPPC